MNRGLRARRLAGLALATALVAGCGVTTVVVENGGLPDEPFADNRVGPATMVAEGNGEAGAYRAWVYRDEDGLTCFELATAGVAASGCGPGDDGPIRIAPYQVDGGWLVGGGTRQPATVAVLHTAAGGERRAPVVPAPGGVTPGTRYVVIGVAGETPETVDLLDDAGNVLETINVAPN